MESMVERPIRSLGKKLIKLFFVRNKLDRSFLESIFSCHMLVTHARLGLYFSLKYLTRLRDFPLKTTLAYFAGIVMTKVKKIRVLPSWVDSWLYP